MDQLSVNKGGRIAALIPFLLALALAGAPAVREPGVSVTAIVGGTVLPMNDDRILAAHTILVRDGRIAWVGPDSMARIPEGAGIIDAAGRWVLPGLADMHVHAGEEDFPAFLANGVTTIREMNGTPEHLEWRVAIREGRLMGPMLIVAGPLIAGEEQQWRHVIARTPEEGRALVAEQAHLGFDAIKIYDGLSRETYDAIASAAKDAGLPIVGHIPRDVGLSRVLEAGQRSIEHVGQIAHGLRSADPKVLESTAVEIAAAGAWVTPTLASEEALSRRGTDWYADRLAGREVGLVDEDLVGWWRSLGDSEPTVAEEEHRGAYLQGTAALVRALHTAGVPLLAGTDTPNPLMVPGYSLHEELAALVAAGLEPYEAIRTATAEAARFTVMEGDFGTVREGARADLIVVSADPLADVGALRRPDAVMLLGEWLPRERLDGLVEEALARTP